MTNEKTPVPSPSPGASADPIGTDRTAAPVRTDRPADPVATGGRRGPNWLAVLVGLACLVISGLVVLNEQVDWSIDWQQYGPAMLIGMGAALVLLGGIGLARRGR